jgi:hypothetical protein
MTPIDLNALDSAVHGPIRLSVLALLRLEGALDFTTLRKRLDVTDGVLGAHLLKLEQAGYVAGARPISRCHAAADTGGRQRSVARRSPLPRLYGPA